MPPALIADLLADIDRRWGLAAEAEISLEANPVSAPEGRLQALKAAGINRLSLGVQAFDARALKFLAARIRWSRPKPPSSLHVEFSTGRRWI